MLWYVENDLPFLTEENIFHIEHFLTIFHNFFYDNKLTENIFAELSSRSRIHFSDKFYSRSSFCSNTWKMFFRSNFFSCKWSVPYSYCISLLNIDVGLFNLTLQVLYTCLFGFGVLRYISNWKACFSV